MGNEREEIAREREGLGMEVLKERQELEAEFTQDKADLDEALRKERHEIEEMKLELDIRIKNFTWKKERDEEDFEQKKRDFQAEISNKMLELESEFEQKKKCYADEMEEQSRENQQQYEQLRQALAEEQERLRLHLEEDSAKLLEKRQLDLDKE